MISMLPLQGIPRQSFRQTGDGTTELFAMVSVHVNTICLHCCGASTFTEYDHA